MPAVRHISTMRAVLGVAAAVIGVGASMTPIDAHHSIAVFDGTRVVKVQGTVTEFRWINPHASIQLDGMGGEGAPGGQWTVEMAAPNVLIGEGWKHDALVVGDKITLFANPLRDPVTSGSGQHRGLYVGVVFSDGKALGRVDHGNRR